MNTSDLDQAKLNLVTNYFAEDWAIEKALLLLEDYQKMMETQPPLLDAQYACVTELEQAAHQALYVLDYYAKPLCMCFAGCAASTPASQSWQHARIAELAARVQELGAMARENRSRRIVELEAQLKAVGAGGVQALSAAPAGAVPKAPPVCPDCNGTGVDGDVGNDGRVVDCVCGGCAGSGKARFLGKCPDGMRCLHGCLVDEQCHLDRRAMLAASTTPPAEQPEDEGISREQWIDQAVRVYLIAGDTEDQALECAAYLWGELDMDDLADPYDAAMSDIEGRGPVSQAAPKAAPATQQAGELVSVPKTVFEKCEVALNRYSQAPTDYHNAVLRLRDSVRDLITAAAPQPAPAPLSDDGVKGVARNQGVNHE